MGLAAIVVEGGAMRGIFAAGVLDVFLEADFAPFDLAIGASAGACNLSSHLARQHGRNRRCFFTRMQRREFVDAGRFLRGGHWLDIDYLWEASEREDPLDAAAIVAGPTKLVVAATCVTTGRPTYFEPDAATMSDVLRASSAVPVLFRRFVEVDGEPFTDGGLSAPIPVEEAYRRGARRILVIRSRPDGFPGPSRLECALAAAMLRSHPELVQAFWRYRPIYARATAFLARPPADCQIVHVAPAGLRTSRVTRDLDVLHADYQRGRAAGAVALAQWRALDAAPAAAGPAAHASAR
ncbi:MAG: patatin family protein [Kofleriaceae bacterium]